MAEVKNKFKCASGLWRKMTDDQRETYNYLRSFKQKTIVHPDTKLPAEHWDTISHNFAFLATQ